MQDLPAAVFLIFHYPGFYQLKTWQLKAFALKYEVFRESGL